ncbi:four helix bundle protein [Chryseobacterium binzhouense]|uniref:four helix bundle protein n=1 Tax=Chryseobacterium binzhouense TaxID=2593646 RepID=UPI00289FFA55|nr:four helix bundle protein [Chryseobacterium binzhouense]
MKKDNVLHDKSKKFAIRIIHCYKFLTDSMREFILSKQLLRSGTAIGALIAESKFAQSDKDFLNKLYIALKEANETLYWLDLLHETNFLSTKEFNSISKDATELLKLLISITKTLKSK